MPGNFPQCAYFSRYYPDRPTGSFPPFCPVAAGRTNKLNQLEERCAEVLMEEIFELGSGL